MLQQEEVLKIEDLNSVVKDIYIEQEVNIEEVVDEQIKVEEVENGEEMVIKEEEANIKKVFQKVKTKVTRAVVSLHLLQELVLIPLSITRMATKLTLTTATPSIATRGSVPFGVPVQKKSIFVL